VRFINGQHDSAPGVGLAVTQRNPSYAGELRRQAADVLRQIAEQNMKARISEGPRLRYQVVELPAQPRHMLILGNHLKGITVSVQDRESPFDALIAALELGAGRLRLCNCGKPFVLLNPRGQFCSSACRQRSYYAKHTEPERIRKRREYHRRQARNQRMRQARKDELLWVWPKTFM
jgi:hypothetical protein